MATIRSFTSLEQSRKLAEILPLESADMHYWLAWSDGVSEEKRNTPKVGTPNNKDAIKTYWCPCWSLASLLEVLKQHCERLETTVRINKNYNVFASGDGFTYRSFDEYPDGIDNIIDACYELILKLNGLTML